MSPHTNPTIKITLILVAIVLPSLFLDWEILEKILPSTQVQKKWYIWVIKTSILVIVLLLPYAVSFRNAPKGHEKEQRILFMASLEIVKLRVGITLDQIYAFQAIFDENKYFIEPSQEKVIKELIGNLHEIRMYDEELKPHSAITKEDRKSFLEARQTKLKNIEGLESVIDKYICKLT